MFLLKKIFLRQLLVGAIMCVPFIGFGESGVHIKAKIGPLCSKTLSWAEVLVAPEKNEKLISCLDQNILLPSSDLSRAKIVAHLKQVKAKCAWVGSLQIPEDLSILRGEHLNDDFLENQLSLLPQFFNHKVEVKMLRRNPISTSCDQIHVTNKSEIKIEGKNYFRWNLPIEGGSMSVTGEFKLLKEVPVLKVNLGIGDRISTDDWVLEKRDVTFQVDVLDKPEDFEGRSLARGLVSGSPIRWVDLKREFLVEKNQMAKVRMGGSDFEITATAMAESSGYQGDWIKLKNTDSQKSFTGVAVAKGVVEVR
jgi:flagella basal body P-ring formation protein FlgA